jgi:hypothetical protein
MVGRAVFRSALTMGMLATTLLVCRAAAHPSPFFQIATVDGLRITVSTAFNAAAKDMWLMVSFVKDPRSTYPVACLSVFRDLRYKLTDAGGRELPLHVTLPRPTAGLPPGYESFTPVTQSQQQASTRRPGCVTTKDYHTGQSVSVSQLYGRLPPGTYRLQITFAPPGVARQATLRPVAFIVPE